MHVRQTNKDTQETITCSLNRRETTNSIEEPDLIRQTAVIKAWRNLTNGLVDSLFANQQLPVCTNECFMLFRTWKRRVAWRHRPIHFCRPFRIPYEWSRFEQTHWRYHQPMSNYSYRFRLPQTANTLLYSWRLILNMQIRKSLMHQCLFTFKWGNISLSL